MDSAAPYVPVITGSATVERLDGARRHLVMLRSLSEEVRFEHAAIVPPEPSAWRSDAATGYAGLLEEMRRQLSAARAALGDAESSLEHHVRSMAFELASLDTASPR